MINHDTTTDLHQQIAFSLHVNMEGITKFLKMRKDAEITIIERLDELRSFTDSVDIDPAEYKKLADDAFRKFVDDLDIEFDTDQYPGQTKVWLTRKFHQKEQ